MYLVLKSSQDRIDQTGSLFEAVRGHWKLDPTHASQCSHVIATIRGSEKVEGVFSIDNWYPSTVLDDRFVFSGQQDPVLESKLLGKKLNPTLQKQGQQNPVLYVEEQDLLEI